MNRYAAVLRRPGIAVALLPYLLARVASAMVMLSLLLHVEQRQGSFVIAGLVTGAFAASVAVVAPVLGRAVDAHGQTPVLVVCGLVHPLALLLVVHGAGDPSSLLTAPGAALAGATLPPLAACMRSLWPRLVNQDQQSTAFAVESIVVEICELGGPLLVGGLVVLIDPGAAVLVAAALSGLGTLLFAATPASRQRLVERRGPRVGRSPLAVRGVRRLVLVVGLGVAAVASLEVSLAAFASERGTPGIAGWLIGAWIVGSLLAGWCYGARAWKVPLPRQLPVLLLLGAVTGLAPLLAVGPLSMAAALVLAGVYLAPSTAAQFTLLSELAPDRRRTEAFTWASTAAFLGIAVGNLAAGPVVELGGYRSGVLVSVSLLSLAAVTAYRGRFRLGLPRPTATTVQIELYEAARAQVDVERQGRVAATRRHDELARQLALLRTERRAADSSDPIRNAELVVARLERQTDELVSSGVRRLDAALADLRTLEQRRVAVLADIDRLRRSLTDDQEQAATFASVTSLPLQVGHGGA